MGKIVSLMVTFALAAATTGCSGDSNSDEIVELSTTTTATSTSTSAPTTTEATTTTTSTSTQVEETTPTTTLEQLAAEIEADLQAGWLLTVELSRDPQNADTKRLDQFFEDPIRSEIERSITQNQDEGIVWRPGADDVNEVLVESATLLDNGSAVVIYCLSNDAVIVEIDSGLVINDDSGSIRYSTRVISSDDGWKLAQSERLGTYEGYQCVG